METDSYDWAHDAFVALNADDPIDTTADLTSSPGKWTTFTTLCPSLPTQASIERHGQITPPEDCSPSEPRRDSAVQQSALPPAQPCELPWPVAHQLHALQHFQPQQAQAQSQPQAPQDRATKRRRTAKPAPASQSMALNSYEQPPGQTAAPAPQPPKRKRGRPKSQPHPVSVQEYSKDGFPFPVSTSRQSHLEKNRVAAHKCRLRRKEYIDGLEARGREASAKNKSLKASVAMLREDVLELKNEVLRHAGCNFWAVDEYLARCAGDLLGMDGPPLKHHSSRNETPSVMTNKAEEEPDIKILREMSAESFPSNGTGDSPGEFDDFFGSLDEEMEV